MTTYIISSSLLQHYSANISFKMCIENILVCILVSFSAELFLRVASQQSGMFIPQDPTDPIGGFSSTFQRLKLDVDTILIQRTSFGVTTYHLLDDPKGHALFTRPHHESGRKFIFFNNPSFPTGSGHYFVLKKMESQGKTGFDQEHHGNQRIPLFLYETFSLHFK